MDYGSLDVSRHYIYLATEFVMLNAIYQTMITTETIVAPPLVTNQIIVVPSNQIIMDPQGLLINHRKNYDYCGFPNCLDPIMVPITIQVEYSKTIINDTNRHGEDSQRRVQEEYEQLPDNNDDFSQNNNETDNDVDLQPKPSVF